MSLVITDKNIIIQFGKLLKQNAGIYDNNELSDLFWGYSFMSLYM